MKIIRFTTPGLQFPDGYHFRLGLLDGEHVIDLTTKDPDSFGSVGGLLRLDEPARVIAETAQNAPRLPLRQLQVEMPVDVQEVWAADVTYPRSREASMEAVSKCGGAVGFYDKVYSAPRPPLFLKATPERCVGPDQHVRIRADSEWNMPAPELVLAVSYTGAVAGYTIGNNISARSIEVENPLYLPQARLYRGACALGPCILLADAALNPKTLEIEMRINRGDVLIFQGKTGLAQMKRSFEELIDYLFRENDFASGVFLLTGTGIVPPDSLNLCQGDVIEIEIPPIGMLRNVVE